MNSKLQQVFVNIIFVTSNLRSGGLTCIWCSGDEAGQEAAVEGARPALPHHSQTRAHDTAVTGLALHTHTQELPV